MILLFIDSFKIEICDKVRKFSLNMKALTYFVGKIAKLLFTAYSHSIVAGGFEEMSYVTRLTPLTLLIMSFDTLARNS